MCVPGWWRKRRLTQPRGLAAHAAHEGAARHHASLVALVALVALVELTVTTFALLGVNMALPGLHGYGEL